MAPEQARGRTREVDARTDLWAVGAMMFSLLAGRYVHQAETKVEMLIQAATQPVASIGEACPEVPAPVRAVIDRALAFDRDARWTDAASMNTALALAFREVTGADLSTIAPVIAPDTGDVDPGSGGGTSGAASEGRRGSVRRDDEPQSQSVPLPAVVTAPAELFRRR
jgi:serine/threonine protein kinase